MKQNDLFYPLGDCAVIVKLGHEMNMPTHLTVTQLAHQLNHKPFTGMIECVPTINTVAVYYDPVKVQSSVMRSPYQEVCSVLQEIMGTLNKEAVEERKTIDIPVCYGEEFGPDLDTVADYNGLDAKEVISIHTEAQYPVYMIGFAPGFPYLGGMSERISTPRKAQPRQYIPAGSVGIAGIQTGIYPIETPGGWQIIGRTPLPLFQPEVDPPSLLQAGDIVRFVQITREQYVGWGEG
jgi:inhibitor of KinA